MRRDAERTSQYSIAELARLKLQGALPQEDPCLSKASDLGIVSGISTVINERTDALDLKFKFRGLLDNALMGSGKTIILTDELKENLQLLFDENAIPSERTYDVIELPLKAPNGRSLGKVTCYSQNYVSKAWFITLNKS